MLIHFLMAHSCMNRRLHSASKQDSKNPLKFQHTSDCAVNNDVLLRLVVKSGTAIIAGCVESRIVALPL